VYVDNLHYKEAYASSRSVEEGHMVERSSADIFSQIEREDPNFDRKLDLITAGAPHFLKGHLLTKITQENCLVIINYILAMQTETAVSEYYRTNTVLNLKKLAE
jgi:hypothetical protein